MSLLNKLDNSLVETSADNSNLTTKQGKISGEQATGLIGLAINAATGIAETIKNGVVESKLAETGNYQMAPVEQDRSTLWLVTGIGGAVLLVVILIIVMKK